MIITNREREILREFAGFISGDIPELHSVEVPRIAESVDRYVAAIASAETREDTKLLDMLQSGEVAIECMGSTNIYFNAYHRDGSVASSPDIRTAIYSCVAHAHKKENSGVIDMTRVVVDKNGVALKPGDPVLVHQIESGTRSAVVVDIFPDSPTTIQTGHWVDVRIDSEEGVQGIPSYILELTKL